MSVKTKAQLLIDVATFLPDNTTEDISAQDVRDRLIDIVDSYLLAASLSDTAYGPTWDTSQDGATKNTLYDKIETLLILDGSKSMTGDLDLGSNDIVDIVNIKENSLIAIDLAAKRLYDDTELSTLDWDLCFYGDKLGVISCNWNTRLYYDSAGVLVIDYDSLRLYDGSAALSLDWQARGLVNVAGNAYIAKWDSTDAAFEVNSTTKPFLPPRMDTTQKNAISGPLSGSIVFDTTLDKLCVYGAASWETITSV